MDGVDVPDLQTRLILDADLTPEDDAAIRELLLAAFPHHAATFTRASFWGSPPEARVELLEGERLVAHLSLERRVIEVGSSDVQVAGVGEVAVQPSLQGHGLGSRLTTELLRVLVGPMPASFAYLACRPAVAPFYVAAGWTPISATYRYLDPDTGRWDVGDGPQFILPAGSPARDWPDGPIDLRGMPW